MSFIRSAFQIAAFCICAVSASTKVFHSEIEEAETNMPPWENTAADREQLRNDLRRVLSGSVDRFDEKVYVDRAARSRDPAFIPLLKQIAERQTPPEKEDTVFLAVRGLSALGVERDYFYRSAKRYATHPKLAAAAIDAVADPYDQEAIGFLNELRKETAGTGNPAAGAILGAEELRSEARQYHRKDLDEKIELAIDGATGGLAGSFEFAGPNGGGGARWIHGRFQDLCQRHPAKVAIALFGRGKTIQVGEDVISPDDVQKWIAQFLTPSARSIWEGLRRGEPISDLVRAPKEQEGAAVKPSERVSSSNPGLSASDAANTRLSSFRTKWGMPVWGWAAGVVVFTLIAVLIWNRRA